MHFVCKKRRDCCKFPSRIIIIREGQVILPTRLRYQLDSKRLCTTRIIFLTNSYVFCSNHPAILYSYSQLHSQLASQLYCTTRITSLTIRDQPIVLLFLSIMLCCSALKIHLLGHHQYINCFPSPPASLLKGRIKIDYLIKSHLHQQFFVGILF